MKNIAAYLLLVISGKAAPSAADVSALLKKLDIESDATQVETLIKALEGKNIDEVLAEGTAKLLAVSSGPVASAATTAAAPKEDKAAEKAKPKEEEADIGGGGADLFGGGGGKY